VKRLTRQNRSLIRLAALVIAAWAATGRKQSCQAQLRCFYVCSNSNKNSGCCLKTEVFKQL
jgi:hypothetical protein